MQMRAKSVGAAVAAALMLGVVCASAVPPVTNKAFQVTVKLSAVFEDEIATNKTVIGKTNVTTQNIIDLALGRSMSNSVPTNIVLAFVLDCGDNNGAFAVIDTTSNAVLTVLGAMTADGASATTGKGQASVLTYNWSTGDSTNGFTGGWLAFTGTTVSSPTNACPLLSFSGKTGLGVLQGVNNGQEFKILIPKGSLTTVRSLGEVALPQ